MFKKIMTAWFKVFSLGIAVVTCVVLFFIPIVVIIRWTNPIIGVALLLLYFVAAISLLYVVSDQSMFGEDDDAEEGL